MGRLSPQIEQRQVGEKIISPLHQLEGHKMALGKQVEELLRVKYKVLGTAERNAPYRAKAA